MIGALVGGGVTLLGVIYQQHSAASSQLQSERQAAYISYYGAMGDFDGDVAAVFIQAELGIVPTNWVNTLITDNGTLQRAGDQVSILASSRLQQIVQKQQKSAETLDIQAQALELRMQYPRVPISSAVPAKSELIAELQSEDHAFAKIETSYENVARADLGTSQS